MEIEKIFLSIDNQGQGEAVVNYENDNTDVIVRFRNGDFYVASFFTYNNIELQREQHEKDGSFLGGSYFWVEGMILIDECSLESVEKVIDELLIEGDFKMVFRKI